MKKYRSDNILMRKTHTENIKIIESIHLKYGENTLNMIKEITFTFK